MTKNKSRALWLEIRFHVPRRLRKEFIAKTLIASVQSGRYTIPRGWHVMIGWRNKEDEEMRTGQWRDILRASSESSLGFDAAVIRYLKAML